MRRLTTVLTTVACAAGLLATAPAASAAAKSHVSLRPAHTDVSATGKATYYVHGTHLRRGTRVALQRYDKKKWVTIARSGKHHGDYRGHLRVAGPGKPRRFTLRAVLTHDGHLGVKSRKHHLRAFGTVSMNALCHGVLDNYCIKGDAEDAHGRTLHYVMATGINEPSDGFTSEIGAAGTSCRSITFRYISDGPDDTTTYLELRQKGAKAQKHQNSSEDIGTFTASLTGKRFDVSVQQDSSQVFMYFNGSGRCFTADGKS